MSQGVLSSWVAIERRRDMKLQYDLRVDDLYYGWDTHPHFNAVSICLGRTHGEDSCVVDIDHEAKTGIVHAFHAEEDVVYEATLLQSVVDILLALADGDSPQPQAFSLEWKRIANPQEEHQVVSGTGKALVGQQVGPEHGISPYCDPI